MENVNNIDERRSKIAKNSVFNIFRPTGDKRQLKHFALAIFDPRSSIVKSVFDCRQSGLKLYLRVESRQAS